MMSRSRTLLGTGWLLAVAIVAFAGLTPARGEMTVSGLLERTHIHGLAVDRADPARLLIATHHGLYVARPDGAVRRLSDHRDDLMGFSAHPDDPAVLYASGHPAGGGNLGVIRSEDGGRTWTRLSPGVHGPVDFHQMTISPADPQVLYGVYRGLQRSDDGGRTWRVVAAPPQGIIALAASAHDPETLYAATEHGILISRDGGSGWMPVHPARAPATAITTTPDGTLIVYLLGEGLLEAAETDPSGWRLVGPELADDVILHLAVDPADPDRRYAATWQSRLLVSDDGGAGWRNFGSD